RIPANPKGERALASEPVYQGEPVLAVAAVDELTAANAIEAIEIDWEPLPFNTDPLDSLRPGSANALTDGNVWEAHGRTGTLKTVKWTEQDFAAEKEGKLPMGDAPDHWTYG